MDEPFVRAVRNVGEMIEALKELPPDMRVQQGFSEYADIVVFNRGSETEHIEMEEGGDWSD